MKKITPFLLAILCSSLLPSHFAFGDPQPTSSAAQPVSSIKEKFPLRGGLGLTFIPAQGVFYIEQPSQYYQGGLRLEGLFRMHPRLTGEISVGFLGSNHTNAQDLSDPSQAEMLMEATAALGLRFQLKPFPTIFSSAKTVTSIPYLAIAAEFSGLFPEVLSANRFVRNGGRAERALYALMSLGASLGGGVEFLVRKHFSFSIDARFFAHGIIDPNGRQSTMYAPTRLGLRASLGIFYTF